jgi:3-oxoacyl-[acyl-carrier protein] reductase
MSEKSKQNSRPTAVIADANFYVGPELARQLAGRGFNLVLGGAKPDLVDELTASGTLVEVVSGVRDLADPTASNKLVEAAMTRFGRIDSAVMFSGEIITGRFVHSELEQLRSVLVGCIEAPYNFMRAVVPNLDFSGLRTGSRDHERLRCPPDPRRTSVFGGASWCLHACQERRR